LATIFANEVLKIDIDGKGQLLALVLLLVFA
jgi:hypothetical protein